MNKVLLALLLAGSASAQNIYVYPKSPHVPVNGIQSITAVVTDTTNQTVNWSTTCGTIISSGKTIGLKSTTVQNCTVTGTLAADGTKTATSVVHFDAAPTDQQAAGVHPRLMITAADVTSLQAKVSNPGNIVYTQGLTNYFTFVQSVYNDPTNGFCWAGAGCGTPRWKITDYGGFAANSGNPFEDDAALYALMALIDPTTGNRATWAAHSHDMVMWYFNRVCYNADTGSGACVARDYSNRFAPFIGSQFVMNNRAQTTMLQIFEAIDWNYSSFTTADKAVMAKVGHIWGAEFTGANPLDVTDGANEHPNPVGAYNDPTIINANASAAAGGSNNYGVTHWQGEALVGMMLDPADDPTDVTSCATSSTTVCASDGSVQKLSAYAVYSMKGWLYRNYANFEDEHIVASAYSLSDPLMCPESFHTSSPPYNGTAHCSGQMSGGFVAEGTGYGNLSLRVVFQTVYAMYLEGKMDPAIYGVQASFMSSAFWQKMGLHTILNAYPVVPVGGAVGYTTQASDGGFGYGNIDPTMTMNYLELYDAKYGNGLWRDASKWFQYTAGAFGGQEWFTHYMGSFAGSGSYPAAQNGINMILNTLLVTSGTNDGDFSSGWMNPPTIGEYDPRNTATLPYEYEGQASSSGLYHYYGRSGWASTASEFSLHCDTGQQSHASSSCGRINFIRNSEALTVGLGGTTNNDGFYAASPTNQNTISYQWNPAFDCMTLQSDGQGPCTLGGMSPDGYIVISNRFLGSSFGSSYYYGAVDYSGAFNYNLNACEKCSLLDNVNLAQREVLWLKPDVAFVYDRAETTSSTSFKKFLLDLPDTVAITGNQAKATSPTGQLLYVTSILGGTLASSPLDISHYTFTPPVTKLLTDTATPASSVRMLHTLEGKDSGGTASATASIASSAGTTYEGGVVGSSAVLFKHNRTDVVSSVTYPASGATTHYVTGLAANSTYTITATGAPASATSDSAGVLMFAAAGTGNVVVGSGGTPTVPTPTSSPTPGTYSTTQSVTLADAGAVICYTLDGSTPSAGVAGTCDGLPTRTYSSAISVATTTTVKAIGTAVGSINSTVLTAAYTITPAATTWYVATTGSDSNPCTSGSPCATPDHAVNAVAAPGDTVSVAAGVYSYGSGAAHFTGGGTSGHPITVACATRGACKITNTVTGNQTVVWLDHDYLTFSGFEVTNSSTGNNLGIYVSASFINVLQNTIHDILTDCTDFGGGGVQVSTTSVHDITIDSNRIYNIAYSGTPKCNSSVVQFDGILAENTGTNDVITNNIVYSVSGGWGIGTTSNSLIAYNTIFNTTNGGIMLNNAPSGAVVENNIVAYTGLLAHDGLYYGGACGIQNGTASATTYRNNDLSNNHNGNYGTDFGCSGTGLHTGDIAVDPAAGTTFVNWQQNGSGDYHEKSGSLTIGAGISAGINHDYAGNARPSLAGYDMGAYQLALPQAATPTFSPVAGTYTGAQAVTLSSSGAVMCFNTTGSPATNGSTGCTSGTLYSGAVTVGSSSTLYAVAGGTGYADSAIGSAAYVITLPTTALPTCTPGAGTYTSTQSVTCSSVTPSSTTYCTVDGSTPTTSSPLCSGVSVATSLTLKAISAASGFVTSGVLSQSYTINIPTVGGLNASGGVVISGTVTIP